MVTRGTHEGPLARGAAAPFPARQAPMATEARSAAAAGPCRPPPPPVGWIDHTQPRGGGRRVRSLPRPGRKSFPLSSARTPPTA